MDSNRRCTGPGEITVRAGAYWAWCEIVVAENAIGHARNDLRRGMRRNRVPRDHGLDMFMGYEFRALPDAAVRAVYDADKRKIIINTSAPTVQALCRWTRGVSSAIRPDCCWPSFSWT